MKGYGSKRVEAKAFWAALQRQLDDADLVSKTVAEAVAVLQVLVKLRLGQRLEDRTRQRVETAQRDLGRLLEKQKGDARDLVEFLRHMLTYYLGAILGTSPPEMIDAGVALDMLRRNLVKTGRGKGLVQLLDTVFPKAPVTAHQATTVKAAIDAVAALVAKAGSEKNAAAAIDLLYQLESVPLDAPHLPAQLAARRSQIDRELDGIRRSNTVEAGAMYDVLQAMLRGVGARGRDLVRDRDRAWRDLQSLGRSQYVHDDARWVLPLLRQLVFPADRIIAPPDAGPFARAIAPSLSHLLPGAVGREVLAVVDALHRAKAEDAALAARAQKLLADLKALQLGDYPTCELVYLTRSFVERELARLRGDGPAREQAQKDLEQLRTELGPGSAYDEGRGMWSGRPATEIAPLLEAAVGTKPAKPAGPRVPVKQARVTVMPSELPDWAASARVVLETEAAKGCEVFVEVKLSKPLTDTTTAVFSGRIQQATATSFDAIVSPTARNLSEALKGDWALDAARLGVGKPWQVARLKNARATSGDDDDDVSVTAKVPPPRYATTGVLEGRRRLNRDLVPKVVAQLTRDATPADKKKLAGIARWMEQCPSGVDDLQLILDRDVRVLFVPLDGGGGYDLRSNTVELNRMHSDAATVNTLVHELTHARQFFAGDMPDIADDAREDYASGIVHMESQAYFRQVLVCRELVHVTRRAKLDVWKQFLTDERLQIWFQLVHGVPYQRRPSDGVFAADEALDGEELESWCAEVFPYFARYVAPYHEYSLARWDQARGRISGVTLSFLQECMNRLPDSVVRPMKSR